VIGIGPSSIGAFEQGLVQNTKALDRWNAAIDQGRLPVERGLILTHDDRIRAAAIERIMCDLTVDVAAICARFNAEPDALDDGLNQARLLAAEGLCRVDGTRITVSPAGRRLVRVVASVFDASLTNTPGRHAKAV
jgi:oxygen-independent coproporphyrinogen-3 oxidase